MAHNTEIHALDMALVCETKPSGIRIRTVSNSDNVSNILEPRASL